MTQPVGTIMRPKHINGEDICLAAYVSINGIRAYTLFNSGSTTDAVSPDLARVAELPLLALDKPVTLQLGCSGSRSKVNFATTAMINFELVHALTFLDIVNLDKYDCILGMPFMTKHKIVLDLGSHEIIIRGKMCIPALPRGKVTYQSEKDKIQNDYMAQSQVVERSQRKLNLPVQDKQTSRLKKPKIKKFRE